MYNHYLDTFIAVVDYGSFNKAAESLYISPTAVMKQINSLEDHLDLKLINRTSSGIKLTTAGKMIYKDAKFMIDYSRKSVNEAHMAMHRNDAMFCVGTSLLNPAKVFMDIWYEANQEFSDYKLHLVSFQDDHNGIVNEIEKLGEKFDFLVGVCNSKTWLSKCQFTKLGEYRKMIAVPRDHRLAKKDILTLDDLHGETLMMVPRGDSETNDKIRDELEQKHPEIQLENTPYFYDIEVFNHAALNDKLLLTIECWEDVHQGLKTIPVDWDYTIDYGLLYSNSAPDDVYHFAQVAQQYMQNKK